MLADRLSSVSRFIGFVARPIIGLRWSWPLLVVLVLSLWMSFLVVPKTPTPEELDNGDYSWQMVYAHFLKHGYQAGHDYMFTYGPLGYFGSFPGQYDPELFWYRYAAELAMKLVLAVVCVLVARRMSGPWKAIVCCLLVLLFLPWADSLYLFPMALAGLLLLSREKLSLWQLVLASVLLVSLGLLKFTFLLFALAVVLFVTLGALAQKPRWALVWPLVCFGAVFCAAWLALGQSLAHVGPYFVSSLEVTSGYGEAMSLNGDHPLNIFLGVSVLLCLGLALLPFPPTLANLRRTWGLRQLSSLGIMTAYTYLAWKHGFVRYDGRGLLFFVYLIPIPFLLPVFFPNLDWRSPLRRGLVIAPVLLTVVQVYLMIQPNLEADRTTFVERQASQFGLKGRYALNPWAVEQQLDRQRTATAEAAQLPLIRRQVGDATVDMLGNDQMLLFFNGLNWRPRPVFHTYMTYTPYLASVNAEFFRSADAPEYVLQRFHGLDNWLPALQDNLALIEILQRYYPVEVVEGPYVLLKKYRGTRNAGSSLTPEIEVHKQIRFGEEVSLDGFSQTCFLARMEFRSTGLGKLRKLLYKPPEVYFEVRTANGEETGRWRLIPAIAAQGFILSPLLMTQQDILDLYGPASGSKVVSFRVTTDGPGVFEEQIGVTLQGFRSLVPPHLRRSAG